MPEQVRHCEHRHPGEEECGAPASFRVSRGRSYDAQLSCRRHLAATVDALIGEEFRPVTVEQLTEVARA